MKKERLVVDRLVIAQMLDPRAQQVAGPPDNAMDPVPLVEEELGQIRAVLASDTGDKCDLLHGRRETNCRANLSHKEKCAPGKNGGFKRGFPGVKSPACVSR